MIFELITIFVLLFIIVGLVYQFLYDIYLWVFILSIVFYLSYVSVKLVYYFKKKKESQTTTMTIQVPLQKELKEVPKVPDKDIQILKEFITKNKKEGFQLTVIKDALLKQGWPKEKVEQALKEST